VRGTYFLLSIEWTSQDTGKGKGAKDTHQLLAVGRIIALDTWTKQVVKGHLHTIKLRGKDNLE
jgi:hypothetical protein